LPGYSEWCQHQHEIAHRAEERARCIEGSHYFHFGDQLKQAKPAVQDPTLTTAIEQAPSWNQRQAAATRDRIRRAIAQLLEQESLPARPTARFQMLLQFSIGGASLYRHRDLWHPQYFDLNSSQALLGETFTPPVENPPDPPSLQTDRQLEAHSTPSNCLSPPSLLAASGGNSPSDQALSDLCAMLTALADSNDPEKPTPCRATEKLLPEAQAVSQASWHDKGQQEALQEATYIAQSQRQRLQAEAAQQRQRVRMQQFLASGDPILVAEALAWAQVNPGILDITQSQLDRLSDRQTALLVGDRSTILAAIESQRQRLNWSEQQVNHDLQQRFGKGSLEALNEAELRHWLKQLSQTPMAKRP